MHKALTNLPVLDETAFAAKIEGWKRTIQTAKPGYGKVVVEWNVAKGPTCLVFPMGLRHLAVNLSENANRGQGGQSDERWADFLEFEFVPKVVTALQTAGVAYQVICTDQRPIQVMRQKRRALEHAAAEKSGISAHH
jgi:hypothetical protein